MLTVESTPKHTRARQDAKITLAVCIRTARTRLFVCRRLASEISLAFHTRKMSTTHELNIGRNYLSYWDVGKALRELIANALDEKQQVGANVAVGFDDSKGVGYIRDTGRGISQDAFIQQETKTGDTIGNFGVGMKDAMTVLDRKGIDVSLYSRGFVARLVFREGTYKAVIKPSTYRSAGTLYVLRGVSPEQMEEAKS